MDGAARLRNWRRALVHALGVLAFVWPALINGQPFFFSDTTSYVRAADLAVQIATRGRVRTAWSYGAAPAGGAAPRGGARQAKSGGVASAHGSDGGGGTSVMSGRSPYFGALLYLGYVTSDFWLFVLAQAAVAWWLLGLALRCFGIEGLSTRLAIAALLALASPVAFYDSLLLADALAGFGILAFLILATGRDRLRPPETTGLTGVMLVSAASHLTHIVMLAAMTGVLGLLWLARRPAWREVGRPILIGAGVVVAGLASVSVTSLIVRAALGSPPAMAPLMTARFIVDGPGRDFIDAGCGGRDFAACRLPSRATNSDVYLWSRDPGVGTFLTADAPTRAALSREDMPFAGAVLKAHPLRQGGMMAWNTLLQIATFDSTVMNQSCFARFACSGIALPDPVRARLQASLSGRDAWPVRGIGALHYATVIAALAALALMLPALAARDRDAAHRVMLWLGLLAVAMLVNGFLGGAISAPQPRYQARIVWLVPLLCGVAALCLRRSAGAVRARTMAVGW